jgi:hypothetical protein
MRAWVLKVHLYGGLLCAPYLLIFGISSLHFNHRFEFMKAGGEKAAWEAPLRVALPAENPKAVEAARAALGLAGWQIPPKTKRDAEGNLRFDLERPGKGYTVHVLAGEGKARVEERRKGFWATFNALHALGPVPGSSLARAWGWYTEVCAGWTLFAAVSGVWLWAVSRRERLAGKATLLAALAASVGAMLWATFWG